MEESGGRKEEMENGKPGSEVVLDCTERESHPCLISLRIDQTCVMYANWVNTYCVNTVAVNLCMKLMYETNTYCVNTCTVNLCMKTNEILGSRRRLLAARRRRTTGGPLHTGPTNVHSGSGGIVYTITTTVVATRKASLAGVGENAKYSRKINSAAATPLWNVPVTNKIRVP